MFDKIRYIVQDSDRKNAFYVARQQEIVEKYNQWKHSLPDVQPHYVVKCNNDRSVLRTLEALQSSFSCSSKTEVTKLMSMGVNAERVIFSCPIMLSNRVKLAKSYKLSTITFETKADLEKIHKIYPEAKLVFFVNYLTCI
ncbi:hypothetical protein GWI33_013482 [Rhynchophorus ferrugineus]|uniref:Orn/DAP/Arg decarboxylase 2 N-terminal domain-containing protein n=1 Tax=Rhynchophorus ferrugineus TaxID=354439 RepID=A0A834I6E2_RHYFE|nr:hypothetical protein GWI33_013482 [Rhynchophorus ferrugineus]